MWVDRQGGVAVIPSAGTGRVAFQMALFPIKSILSVASLSIHFLQPKEVSYIRTDFDFTEGYSLMDSDPGTLNTQLCVLLQLWHLLTHYFPFALSQLFSVFLSLFLFHTIPSASSVNQHLWKQLVLLGTGLFPREILWSVLKAVFVVCVRGGLEDASPPLPAFHLKSQRKDFLPLPLVHSGTVDKVFLLPFYHFLLEAHWAWQFFIVQNCASHFRTVQHLCDCVNPKHSLYFNLFIPQMVPSDPLESHWVSLISPLLGRFT